MTSLLPTEEEDMLRDAARRFLADEAPVSAFRKMRDTGQPFDRGLWVEIAQMGWSGVLIGEAAGGSEMGHSAALILAEEMGRTLAATPFISTSVIAAVALSGNQEAQKNIASGEVIYALAIDEGPKFSPAGVGLSATGRSGGFVLTGEKTFVADGMSADRLLVLATAPDGPVMFDVDANLPGISRTRHAQADSRDFAKVTFAGLELSDKQVVGEPGRGLDALEPALLAGQAAVAAELTGLARGAFEMTLGYLKERKQFGMTIGAFQALRHRSAHLWSELEVTGCAVCNAGRVLDAGLANAELAVSVAKARACDTAKLTVNEGVQMHGGIGMTDEYDMGFYMKRARVATEWLGDYGYHAQRVARARGLAV